jgi:hypothetical protein
MLYCACLLKSIMQSYLFLFELFDDSPDAGLALWISATLLSAHSNALLYRVALFCKQIQLASALPPCGVVLDDLVMLYKSDFEN